MPALLSNFIISQVFTQWGGDHQDSEIREEVGGADRRTLTQANLATAASSLNLLATHRYDCLFLLSACLQACLYAFFFPTYHMMIYCPVLLLCPFTWCVCNLNWLLFMLSHRSKATFKTSLSGANLKSLSGTPLTKKSGHVIQTSDSSKDSLADSLSSLPLMGDHGLFQAAKFANPVLPQYHPKLLMELLNFGKTKRVLAILAHLVRCIRYVSFFPLS